MAPEIGLYHCVSKSSFKFTLLQIKETVKFRYYDQICTRVHLHAQFFCRCIASPIVCKADSNFSSQSSLMNVNNSLNSIHTLIDKNRVSSKKSNKMLVRFTISFFSFIVHNFVFFFSNELFFTAFLGGNKYINIDKLAITRPKVKRLDKNTDGR